MTHICSNPRDVLIATARAMAETASHPDHKAEWAALATELDGGRPDVEQPVVPVDGREVRPAPHVCEHRPHVQEVDEGDSIVMRHCCCPIGESHTTAPETDGAAAVPPTAAAPSPHAEKES